MTLSESRAACGRKRVFVAGATGAIGRATVRALLARGHDVVCVVRARAGSRRAEDVRRLLPGAIVRWGEVTDPVSLDRDGFGEDRFDAVVSCVASRSGAPGDAWAIDYQAQSVESYVEQHTAGAGFDIVYDTVGGSTLDASFKAVKPYTGHVVSCLGWGEHSLAPLSFRSATYSGVFTLAPLLTGQGREHHGAILREAAELADAGQLTIRVDRQRFALDEVNDAFRQVAEGRAKGKTIIQLLSE